ncbi:biopolymer transporter ExbB [Iodidimonas muriae]|uniref:Biopolymer transporter ExbB n=1 Tax=Iodidimonas muriae TaxID=261467 RepID=A0ABQ2LCL2_9PROT|nr:MotA/TolQ/ExbB proton channel family protein [Iodidimonas muriae]GER07389.1 biopolymer transporter ExbB [Kordiimonadales bacterium JCM 17843]GGO10717.1 biopolymer transporter ExbB [Iodidimonas muriae]
MNKFLTTAIALVMGGLASTAFAQDATEEQPAPPPSQMRPADLDSLLDQVRRGRVTETSEHRQREAEFRARRDQQDRLLTEANQEQASEERTSERLEKTIQDNEQSIRELDATLQERLGELKEMFGVLQQVAGDTRGTIESSLITVEYGKEQRLEGINNLIAKASRSSTLPSIDEIEVLWQEMMLEMVASGEVTKFDHSIVAADGEKKNVELVRVGNFNLVSDGKYYDYLPESGNVVELGRQPSARFTGSTADLVNASAGDTIAFGVDPTRGQLLGLLIQSPTLQERVDQGGAVGYVTLGLGAIGVVIAILKMITLSITTAKVRSQTKAPGDPKASNPLGRVLTVYKENPTVDVETLELKLDEAILRETPSLERGLTVIKLISAVAPLLGLLGTVTGMIATFQAITLFGTGDPKLMANGISQALVTTVIGLVVAIPTLLLHSFVAGMSKRVIHILEEQSAGIVAVHAEKEQGRAVAS